MLQERFLGFLLPFLVCSLHITAQNILQTNDSKPRVKSQRILVVDEQGLSFKKLRNDASIKASIIKNRNDRNNNGQALGIGPQSQKIMLCATNNYREFMMVELGRPLEHNKKYRVSFKIRLAEESSLGIRDIGVLFTENNKLQQFGHYLKNYEQLKYDAAHNFSEIRHWRYYTNKSGWTQVSTTIISNGKENYLTLGNFRDELHAQIQRTTGNLDNASYFFDGLSVVELFDGYAYKGLPFIDPFTLEDVIFEPGSSALTERSKNEIDRLYREIKNDSTLFVSVRAHADTSPQEIDALPLKRARSVAKYIVSLGLPTERIHWLATDADNGLVGHTPPTRDLKSGKAEFTIGNSAFESRESMAETLFEDDN